MRSLPQERCGLSRTIAACDQGVPRRSVLSCASARAYRTKRYAHGRTESFRGVTPALSGNRISMTRATWVKATTGAAPIHTSIPVAAAARAELRSTPTPPTSAIQRKRAPTSASENAQEDWAYNNPHYMPNTGQVWTPYNPGGSVSAKPGLVSRPYVTRIQPALRGASRALSSVRLH